eukprot:3933629-Rhodomonas_salina.2
MRYVPMPIGLTMVMVMLMLWSLARGMALCDEHEAWFCLMRDGGCVGCWTGFVCATARRVLESCSSYLEALRAERGWVRGRWKSES